jgi:hypothetical protein
MLFPLESVSHLPDSNISALDHDYLLADASDAVREHGTTFSDDARHQPGLELGLALSLAFVVNAIIDACARRNLRAGDVGAYPSAPRRSGQAFGARG